MNTINNIANGDLVPTSKCKLIHSLPTTLSNIEMCILYQVFNRENNPMVINEFISYFCETDSTYLLTNIIQSIELGSISDNSTKLLFTLLLHPSSVNYINCECLTLEHLFKAITQTINSDITELEVASLKTIIPYCSKMHMDIPRIVYCTFFEKCSSRLMSTLEIHLFELLCLSLSLITPDTGQYILCHYNVPLIIQSTILSPLLSICCTEFIRLLIPLFDTPKDAADFFKTDPLPDYLIEAFIQHPQAEVLLDLLPLFSFTESIATEVISTVPALTLNHIPLLIHLAGYLSPHFLRECIQCIINTIPDTINIPPSLLQFISSNKLIYELNLSTIIPQILSYLVSQSSHPDCQNDVFVVLEAIIAPQYYTILTTTDCIHVLLELNDQTHLYKLVSQAFFALSSTPQTSFPSSVDELIEHINTSSSLAIVLLSLSSTKCIISTEYIPLIQPVDDLGILLLHYIKVLLQIPTTSPFPDHLPFGDSPFSGLLSLDVLRSMLVPVNMNSILNNYTLVHESLNALLSDSNYYTIPTSERLMFEQQIEWFKLLTTNTTNLIKR